MVQTINEKVLKINDINYYLQPNSNSNDVQHYEVNQGYEGLNHRATNAFNKETIDTPLINEHKHILKKHLPTPLCSTLISEYEKDKNALKHPSVLKSCLPYIMTEEVGEHLSSYFKSEYCIMWWAMYKIENHNESDFYYTKWHCDGGPKNHLKMIIYLNGYDEHGSSTAILNQHTSDKLKDVGYIFNNVKKRNVDIAPLCQYYDIKFSPELIKLDTGDALIFNPHELAHKAVTPNKDHARYALTLCFLPSELDWKTVAEKHFWPETTSIPFEGFPEFSKKFTQRDYDECIDIALNNNISNFQHIAYLLRNIIKNDDVANMFINHIKKNDPELKYHNTLFELIKFIKQSVLEQFNAESMTEEIWPKILNSICSYERTYIDSCTRYNINKKPDPKAVFWPDPDHPKHPSSKYDILPYVSKMPIMDMTTPIGSAGSCFAFEIAKVFQQDGYNYVITERNDDIRSGVVIDGYQPGDKYAKFCANYGILFNTPSFKQLAEKAFGIKNFDKLIFQSETGHYVDPYRENVFFNTKEDFLADYDKHVQAVKNSFLNCQVFVITLGLNECWELQDGTVMSRNPRSNTYQFVKHKTLTVEENVSNIQTFFDIIKQHNPDFKLIISISPIPFLATARADEHHIITANTHSKAVLRVAAEELVNNNEDMYYLPSYELVTECTEDAWNSDTRHVKPTTVSKVVNMFKEIFVQ
jgi:hypothetical protein